MLEEKGEAEQAKDEGIAIEEAKVHPHDNERSLDQIEELSNLTSKGVLRNAGRYSFNYPKDWGSGA